MSQIEEKKQYYPQVDANPDFVKLEEEILSFWKKENIFQQSVDKNKGTGEQYVFYDGPPFANGLPHYGHLLTGYVKDLVARYQTMRGRVVERRFGWDCHGLPAEMGAEKELGISGRQAIIEYGIGKFNDYCRENVMRYASEWERYVDRQGRWVDFQNDYKTMDRDFMESVIWAFSELYKKGLIYESYRVMPYSWAAETPLSNFETRLDNATREREDKAITVAFELDSRPEGAPEADKYYLLAWTTTPWTLPSNLALAVHPGMEYMCIVTPSLPGLSGQSMDYPNKSGNDCFIFAASGFNSVADFFGVKDVFYDNQAQGFYTKDKPADPDQAIEQHSYLRHQRENSIKGSAFLGLTYKPLFPYFAHLKHAPHTNPLPEGEREATAKAGAGKGGAFRILDGSSFIEEGSGTGVVHLAPGFGEDDQKTCEAGGIAIVCPVDDKGRYTDEIFDLAPHPNPLPEGEREAKAQAGAGEGVLKLKGLNVIADTRKEEGEPYTDAQLQKYGLANLRIINWLKQNGQLIKQEDFKHNYPHCWRTDTPIIYRALPSWYVQVTAFKDRAVELNKNIHWIPEHTRDGAMGHMLGSAPDWSISRNRFWGCPIPVWKSPSGKIKVFGSIEELEKASGQKVEDLHRPFIDEIVIKEGGEEYRRVEEVLDCWFESGSMPYAQLHYPFENAEKFKANYPGDFITEYIGQTRGWFNTLIMLATALFDEQPFNNCICHGVVIDEETGLKYSKRLKNYKDPMEVFDTFGADALRWLMVASGVMRGHDLGVDPEGKFIRDVVRLNIKPIWNAYNFFTLYANADGVQAEFSTDSDNLMDQYILAKCRAMVEGIQSSLDAYDTPGACEAVMKFVEVLNNWYIRRCRPRFWGTEKTPDKQAAYNTLYTVLHTLCRAAAPLLPFTLEAVFRGLTDEQSSVHLAEFPNVSAIAEKTGLVANMDVVRGICNAALSIRNKANIRVRQPLSKLDVFGTKFSGDDYCRRIIEDEVNVKEVEFKTQEEMQGIAAADLKIISQVVGKKHPKEMKLILAASKKMEYESLENGDIKIAGVQLIQHEDFVLNLKPNQGYENNAASFPLGNTQGLVVLDLSLTPELIAEGMARDVVRMVQESRKKADLHISDKISLVITAPDAVAKAVETGGNKQYIADQVLAASVTVGAGSGEFSFEHELEGEKVVISFSKVA